MEDNNKVIYRVYKGLTPIKKIMHGLTVVYEWIDGYIKTKTGVPPIKIDDGNGQNLVNYKVYGETVQEDGTPTPDNPVEVKGVGNKTINLFDEKLLLKHGNIEKNEQGYLVKQYPAVFDTATGYDSARAIVDSLKSILKPNVTYTMARKVANYTAGADGGIVIRSSTDSLLYIGYGTGVGLSCTTFSFTQEQIDSISNIYVYGRAGNNPILYEYIQLVEGSYTAQTMPAYEPYGYKIPIEVGGKNLFDVNGDINRDLNGTLAPNQFHGNYIVSGNQFLIRTSTWATNSFGQFINVEVGKTYTVSLDIIEWGSCPVLEVQVHAINPNANLVRIHINAGENTMTFSFTATTDTVHLAFAQTGIGYGDHGLIIGDVQVEEGNTATPYESYRKEIAYIYLDESLYTIDDHVDYIDYAEQKAIRKNKKAIIQTVNNSEKIKLYSNSFENIRVYMLPNALPDCNIANIYNTPNKCNKFAFKNGEGVASYAEADGEWLALRSGTIYIAVKTENLTEDTIAAAVNYINSLNIEVVYQLAEEMAEEVALPAIKTNIGVNVISVGTEIVPSNMEIQYYK